MKQFPLLSLVLLLICYISFGWYLSSLPPARSPILLSTCHQVFGIPIQEPLEDPLNRERESLDLPRSHSDYGRPSQLPSSLERKSAKSESGSSKSESKPPSETPEKPQTDPVPAAEQAMNEKGEPQNNSKKSASKLKEAPPPSMETSQRKIAESMHNPCAFMVRHNIQIGFLAIAWIFISAFAFIAPLTSFSRFISRWFKSDTVAFLAIFCMAALAAVILYWLHVALQILTILAAEALARIEIQMSGSSGLQAFWILTLVSLLGLSIGWFGNAII